MVDVEESYLWRLLFRGGDCFHLKYHDSLFGIVLTDWKKVLGEFRIV